MAKTGGSGLHTVDNYLRALYMKWSVQSGLTEEIALAYLATKKNYNINDALRETIVEPKKLKHLITLMSKNEERTETIAFINSLTDDNCFF